MTKQFLLLVGITVNVYSSQSFDFTSSYLLRSRTITEATARRFAQTIGHATTIEDCLKRYKEFEDWFRYLDTQNTTLNVALGEFPKTNVSSIALWNLCLLKPSCAHEDHKEDFLPKTVSLLIKNNADLRFCNPSAFRPRSLLELTYDNDRPDVARLLIDAKADCTITPSSAGAYADNKDPKFDAFIAKAKTWKPTVKTESSSTKSKDEEKGTTL